MRDDLKKQHNVKVKIKEVAEKQGITTAYQLQIAAGIAPSVAQNLFNDKFTEISMQLLERVCNALKCQPSALFEVPMQKDFFDMVAQEAKEKSDVIKDKNKEKRRKKAIAAESKPESDEIGEVVETDELGEQDVPDDNDLEYAELETAA